MTAENDAQSDPTVLDAGTTVDGRYRIDCEVGRGGFGCVYAAWHLSLEIKVALKVLCVDPEISAVDRADLVARFLDEARVLTRLAHPNIVSALDLGTLDLAAQGVGAGTATPYLVMEWCEGRTLKDMLAARGRLPLREAYAIVERLADALGHAHAMGVAHRDVKPSNVMMARGSSGDPVPRLVDFGIAKLAEPGDKTTSGATLTATPWRAFTPAYAAPEQVAGARTGPWTDVHALGLLFIELVTGEPPYAGSDDMRLAVIDEARPTADRGGVHTGSFEAVIRRALALRPQERYADAAELKRALRAAARDELGSDGAARGGSTQAPPATRTPWPAPAPAEWAKHLQAGMDSTEPLSDAIARPPPPQARVGALAGGAAVLALAIGVRIATSVSPPPTAEPTGLGATAGSSEQSDPPPAVSSAPPAPGQSAPAQVAARTFCDLSEEEGKARVRPTGLRGYGWNTRHDDTPLTSLRTEDGRWLTVSVINLAQKYSASTREELLRGAKLALARASEGLDLLEGAGIAYALEGTCFVSVRGPTAEALRIRGELLRGLSLGLAGDTFGGPNAIPFNPIRSQRWDGTKARSVGALTEGELVERIRGTGALVADITRAGNALSIDLADGPRRWSIVYDADPNISWQMGGLTSGGTPERPVYYATERDIVIVASGKPTQDYLGRVLEGLGAKVIKVTK